MAMVATFRDALLLMISCAVFAGTVNGDFTMQTPVMSSDIICWDQCQYFEDNQTFAIINYNNIRSAMGVAYFSAPIRMKDPATGTVTSFATTFTFREEPVAYNASTSSGYGGEGFTFMMATSSSWRGDAGGRFGIFDSSRPSKVVAVEFDNWQSEDTDPGLLPSNGTRNEHVALDVGSPNSVPGCFAYPYSYRAGITFSKGDVLYSWIEYDGTTTTLQVRLANAPLRPAKALVYCQYDLSTALEEKMWIGFSGSSGDYSSVYYIYNWTFTSFGISSEFSTGPSKTPFPISRGPKSAPSEAPHPSAPHTSSPYSRSSGASRHVINMGLIGGVVCGILLTLLAVAALGVRAYQRKKRALDKSWDNQEVIEMGGMPEFICYKDLSAATKKFSDQSKLGQGGFGSVYRGVLPKTGAQVAVKKVSNDSRQGEREFLAEVKIISQLRHRNVVELMGYCREKRKFLLVYEFLPRGSLDQALFKPKTPEDVLSWSQRWKIVSGAAAALHYLHEGWRQQVIHRDVKSSNIMLDEEHNPKLGDFGLARLVDHQKVATTTMVAGTFGYIAPEAAGGKFTDKTDVFAFGAVALEVACGRKAYDPRVKNCDDLILKDMVWRHLREDDLLSVADPSLSERFDVEQMYIVLKLGLLCSHPDPTCRPSMRQVVQVMAGDADVPDVRQSMPEASLASSDLPHLSIAELLHSRSGSQASKSSDNRPESSASVPSSSSYCSSGRIKSQLFPR